MRSYLSGPFRCGKGSATCRGRRVFVGLERWVWTEPSHAFFFPDGLLLIPRAIRSLRVWTLSGECVGEYFGHASFVFDVAVVPNSNIIASASEDHTVKLWRGTYYQEL